LKSLQETAEANVNHEEESKNAEETSSSEGEDSKQTSDNTNRE